MSNVLLSICIPTYNHPESLSVLIKQIVPFQSEEIEIIIGDDNPTSNRTYDLVKKINDPKIKYFRNKKNLGYDANLLKCIKKATGEFIFIQCDDDDIEIKTIPWILRTIKSNKNLTQLCGTIGNHLPGYDKIYAVFGDRILNRGYESLKELFLYYYHGCGIVLKKNALDIDKAKKYIGFLYMQQVLIAQALIAGDTLCTPKIFAYVGKYNTLERSNQPLYKGKMYGDPIHRLYQEKFRVQLVYEITTGMKSIRKILLKRRKQIIYSRLYYLISRSLINPFRIIIFLEGLALVINMKKISKSTKFWIGFILKIFYEFLKSSRLSHYLLLFLSRIDYTKSRFRIFLKDL